MFFRCLPPFSLFLPPQSPPLSPFFPQRQPLLPPAENQPFLPGARPVNSPAGPSVPCSGRAAFRGIRRAAFPFPPVFPGPSLNEFLFFIFAKFLHFKNIYANILNIITKRQIETAPHDSRWRSAGNLWRNAPPETFAVKRAGLP